MHRNKFVLFLIIFSFFLPEANADKIPKPKRYDIVIYGATSAGISSAIQSSRSGKKVLLIEPSQRVGGLTTGGLGATDIGNKNAIGGIAREFYQNIYKHYADPKNWKWQDRSEYVGGGDGRNAENEDAMWTFEPSAALKVYKEMMGREKIEIVYGERLNRKDGVKKSGTNITEIVMESGAAYAAKVFIDASYEGDLMATARVSYTYGRESNDQYGETLNGVQANKFSLSLNGSVSRNAHYHNFIDRVDPYVVKGDKSSGVLPYINTEGPGVDGDGDKKIQAYCFRMTLTDHPENRIPFTKPGDYNELNYELLLRNYEAADEVERMYTYGDPLVPWINTPMPNRKTDTNNQKGFSTDFIGQNYNYPEGSYEEREKIVENHRSYQQGLMWTLAYHPRIPEKVRAVVSKWGTCKDEYDREDGWQQQLYIREARRMVSGYVMSQKHCERLEVVEDPVGLAAYGMDSHMIQRYIDANGYVQNEGNVECRVAGPYPISYRSIVPKKEECTNL
ncbi:MAG TPA: FAD-dependent oxidoreductase, partial [Chryseosolibacter sp.]